MVQKLLEWYKIHDGIFTGYLPESKPPNGVSRGSYEHIMFLTLSVSLDYQRSANDLWDSAKEVFNAAVDDAYGVSPKSENGKKMVCTTQQIGTSGMAKTTCREK